MNDIIIVKIILNSSSAFMHDRNTNIRKCRGCTIAHEAGTLLITIYLNFPSIVRHTVPCWLSSRHFNIHGLSGRREEGGLRQTRWVFSGHIDVRLQRGNANQNVEEKKKMRCCSIRATSLAGGRRTDKHSHRQSFFHSFWLLLSLLCFRSPWKSHTSSTRLHSVSLSLLHFSPRWLEYIDAQTGERFFICR